MTVEDAEGRTRRPERADGRERRDGPGRRSRRLQAGAQPTPTQELRNTEPVVPATRPVKGGPLEIDAVAQQWIWRFFYPAARATRPSRAERPQYSPTGGRPGDRTYSVSQLVVPVDTPVVLNITSTDVIHRWCVPALGGQVDAVPGHEGHTWFKADGRGLPGPVGQVLGLLVRGDADLGAGRDVPEDHPAAGRSKLAAAQARPDARGQRQIPGAARRDPADDRAGRAPSSPPRAREAAARAGSSWRPAATTRTSAGC